MTRILTAITATCVLLAFSAAAADDSPFRMDKKLFKSRVKVVALSPIDAAPALQMPDSAEVIVQGEITKHLEKRGYEVIPASVLRKLRATMEQQVGGGFRTRVPARSTTRAHRPFASTAIAS